MTIYRLVHSGELDAVRQGRSFRVPETAVNEYLRAAFAPTSLEDLREDELLPIIMEALPKILDLKEIYVSPPLARGKLRPDFMAPLKDGRTAIVEVKGVTPDTQIRLEQATGQLTAYREAYKEDSGQAGAYSVLVVPGPLSGEHRYFLKVHGIDQVIDGDDIREALGSRFLSARIDLAVAERTKLSTSIDTAHELLRKLTATPPGNNGWVEYQALCAEILEFLFCPPLGKPIPELSTRTKERRRDFVLSNYSTDPSDAWSQMRVLYRADFVVVEAKNWAKPVDKDRVLQVSDYLNLHGTGLFAIMMTRKGCSPSAQKVLEDVWRDHQKMITVLDDSDVSQMLARRQVGENPAHLIRRKIEDFRLGF